MQIDEVDDKVDGFLRAQCLNPSAQDVADFLIKRPGDGVATPLSQKQSQKQFADSPTPHLSNDGCILLVSKLTRPKASIRKSTIRRTLEAHENMPRCYLSAKNSNTQDWCHHLSS